VADFLFDLEEEEGGGRREEGGGRREEGGGRREEGGGRREERKEVQRKRKKIIPVFKEDCRRVSTGEHRYWFHISRQREAPRHLNLLLDFRQTQLTVLIGTTDTELSVIEQSDGVTLSTGQGHNFVTTWWEKGKWDVL
jgi:hypothetical protein